MSVTAPTENELRLGFFDYLFSRNDGFLCIAFAPKNKLGKKFEQQWFQWPSQREAVGAFVEETYQNNNMWFGINLFRRPERKRDYALPTRLVWADLDYCNPGDINPPPQCRLETSPKRFQAIWRLEEELDPLDAQTLSKRIAYAYEEDGADKSGWDIEQLLRIPFTYNYKYAIADGVDIPQVKLLTSFEALLPVEVFENVTPPVADEVREAAEPMPDPVNLPSADSVVYKYRSGLSKTGFFDIYDEEPDSDWSGVMWRLINICFEVGMDKDEAFSVAIESKCNKYDRDDRPIVFLWREVLKAEYKQKTFHLGVKDEYEPIHMPTLYEGDEPESFITEYKDWAQEATDAVVEYHEVVAFIVLSALLSSSMYFNTSFGKIIPNIWALILGDSTLTRKTTAMKMGMSFVTEIDREIIVASEGSVEGLFTGIAARPNLVSVFYKDEVAGFIDSINRKDYLAGMPETMTQLYDVPEYLPRRLRKETIIVSNPVFIFFGGGIKDKMFTLLNDTHILSGFLPRFLIVSGEADVSKLRPTGLELPELSTKRTVLRDKLLSLHTEYNQMQTMDIGGGAGITTTPIATKVVPTNDAWEYWNKIDRQLTETAQKSQIIEIAQPTFGRLSWSILKLAILAASARQGAPTKTGLVTVNVSDIEIGAYYGQRWGRHSIEMIQNVGRSQGQRIIDKVYSMIRKNPSGLHRSDISRNYNLDKKQLDLILETLLDRGQITGTKGTGRGSVIKATS